MERRLALAAALALTGACSPKPAPAPVASPTPLPTRTRVALQPQFNADMGLMQRLFAIDAAWKSGPPPATLAPIEAAAARSSDLSEQLSRAWTAHGYPERALVDARQAVHLVPTAPTALLRLGQLERSLELAGEAGKHLRAAVAAAPDALETRIALAQALQDDEHYAEAEEQWRSALELEVANPGLWSALAACRLRRGDFVGARSALREAERLAPQVPTVPLQAAEIARQQARGGGTALLDEAEREARTCLDLQPDLPPALSLLGIIREERGDDAGAREFLEKAYAAMPGIPELQVRLAQVLLRQGQRTRGMALLAEHQKAERRREERRRLIAQVGDAPEDPDRRRALARWSEAHGDTARALVEWDMVRRTKPGDPEAKAALARLDTHRPTPQSASTTTR